MKNTRSILAASDLTEASDDVLRAAAALAELTNARLHVLHAFDMELSPYMPRNVPGVEDWVRDARADLDQQIGRALPASATVASREVVIDRAHRAIRERAQAIAADLIVIGRHRPRPAGDVFLGSTADRVIRTAEAPCLVIGAPLALPLRRIIVPLDLSAPALEALDVALDWAASLRASSGDVDAAVTVLHVIPHVYDVADTPFDTAVIGPRLQREVEEARRRVSGSDDVRVREVTRWGDRPADEIVAFAEEERAGLLVLATHGHGGLKRFLIGSVAPSVARAAPCPVLLIPPSRWE